MADLPAPPRLMIRIFTHPACSGCPQAVQDVWRFSQAHPDVELRTIRLENKEGLAEAHAEGVKTIPTVILESDGGVLERWSGTPAPGALEEAYAQHGVG